jgi:hypothetical protein
VFELRLSLVRVLGDPHGREQQLQRRQLLQRLVVQLARPTRSFLLRGREASLQRLHSHVLSGRDRSCRGRRKRAQQFLVSDTELRPLAQPIEAGQYPEHPAAKPKRDEQAGLSSCLLGKRKPQPARGIGQTLRFTRAKDVTADCVLDRDPLPLQRAVEVARKRSDHEPAPLREQDHHRPRLNQRAAALGDQLEHVLEIRLARECLRDLTRGLEACNRPLGLVPAALHERVGARVLDRDRSPLRQHDERLLVLA